MLTTLFSLLTSGAGGGILGGLFGIFKQSQERKERVEMARIMVERDQLEYKNAAAERDHALMILDKTGQLEVQKIATETDAQVEIAHQSTLSSAQDVFKTFKTDVWMDNLRASVRPVLAYWVALLFSGALAWAFIEFKSTIDHDTGRSILLGLFGTLTFIVTSVTTFYYVSRRNNAPR